MGRGKALHTIELLNGARNIILYLGDYDPSGMGMSVQDLPRRLASYAEEIDFEAWDRYVEAERVERASILETVKTWRVISGQAQKYGELE